MTLNLFRNIINHELPNKRLLLLADAEIQNSALPIPERLLLLIPANNLKAISGTQTKTEAKMASNPDREILSARMFINLVSTRVSGVFRSSTSFPFPESFSAPKGARKCLSPNRWQVLGENLWRIRGEDEEVGEILTPKHASHPSTSPPKTCHLDRARAIALQLTLITGVEN